MGNAAAANNVTNWAGTCYITPLIGAFLADSYLGRYWTIASFSIIYVFVSFLPKPLSYLKLQQSLPLMWHWHFYQASSSLNFEFDLYFTLNLFIFGRTQIDSAY